MARPNRLVIKITKHYLATCVNQRTRIYDCDMELSIKDIVRRVDQAMQEVGLLPRAPERHGSYLKVKKKIKPVTPL